VAAAVRDRGRLLVGLFASLAALACSDPPRDVLLITVDTLRADHLSSYGFELATSPNIDDFASQAALFERAVAASSSTAPSHASILTSLYPRQHSIGYRNGDTRLEGAVTLPEVLGALGNAVLRRRIGLDRGFGIYDDELPEAEANRPLVFERRARDTTERALAWLQDAREPFFLWVHYQDPHGPYAPPEGYADAFAPSGDPDEPPLPRLDRNLAVGGIPAYQVLPGLTRASEYRARYADEIRYADHWIGKLLASPRLLDAVVVLTADHGESLGEAGRYFVHGTTTLPPEAHVPLLVRAPGVAPARIAATVSHVDVAPTILELAGVPVPDGLAGVSLGPALRGETPFAERIVYCDMGTEASAYGDGVVLQTGRSDPAWRLWEGGTASPDEAHTAIRARLATALADYARDAVPMVPAPAADPVDIDRLRALGYVE